MKTYDIAIIGQGITGLSAALYLRKAGFKNLCIIAPNATLENTATLSSHHAAVSLQDNISRFAHNLGNDTALDLLELNRKGFSDLHDYIQAHDLSYEIGEVLRFADSDHEVREMSVAIKWLSEHGFPADMRQLGKFSAQRDGATSLSLNASVLLDSLRRESQTTNISNQVVMIESHPSGLSLCLGSGENIGAEMVILACHLGIKKLLPALGEALVNHADQVMRFRTSSTIQHANPGDVIFTQHSQYWAVVQDKRHIVAGGARFLRKWGGVEATFAEVLPQITTAVAKKFAPILGVKNLELCGVSGMIDLRSCDERPLIGPMFGDSRILLGSGYMGSGITLGFATGKGLAEFVSAGRSKLIPEVFHPTRLRSLSDSD